MLITQLMQEGWYGINMTDNKLQQDATLHNVFIAGIDEKRFDIEIRNGRFVSITESIAFEGNSSEDLWISPGVIDLHTHLAWTDFHHDDQLKRDEAEIEALQVQAFEATFKAGVTTARDAGGLLPDTVHRIHQHYDQPLRVYTSGEPLGGNDAKGVGHVERRVQDIIHGGASWIKIFATGGLGASPDQVLNPLLSKEEILSIVRTAHANHIKVMVHAWGGPAVDWSIEAGVDSIEHGIYMTQEQAYQLAESNIYLVPTATIYRIAAEASGPLGLDQVFRERAAFAAEAHTKAIHYAKKAGVQIGMGTDFATPALNGRNLEEIDTLIDCGLTRDEAWRAATALGAEMLGLADKLGRIKEDYAADAILFRADPYKAQHANDLRRSIVSVIKGNLD